MAWPPAATRTSQRTAAAVFVVGAAVAALAWWLLRTRDLAFEQTALELAVTERVASLEAQAQRRIAEVRATSTFLQRLGVEEGPRKRAHFEEFSAAMLAGDPKLETLAWVVRVRPEDEAAFRAAERARFPEEASSAARPRDPGAKDRFATWEVASALARPEVSRGTDWAAFPMAMATLDRAIEVGDVGATGPLAPLAREGATAPIAFLAPLYRSGEPTDTPEQRREALTGFVVVLERVPEMLEEAAAGLSPRGVDLVVQDVTDAADPRVLATRPTQLRAAPGDLGAPAGPPDRSHAVEVEIAGRRWRVVGLETDVFAERPSPIARRLVLVGGLVVSALASALVATSAGRAEQAAARRTSSMAHAAIDAIVAADHRDRITYVNPAAERLFGHPAHHLIGRSITELIPERYRAAHLAGLKRYVATGEGRIVGRGPVELVGLRADGEEVPIELSLGSWTEPGGHPAFAAMIRSITERRRLEEQRQAAEDELRRATVLAEEATRAKSEFLANMSHEIRTPLNSIVGLVDLLRTTEHDRRRRSDLDQVARSADGLLRLLGDILDFSRIEARRLEVSAVPFALRDTLGGTLHSLSLRAREKGLELAYRVAPGVPDHLVGDPGRLNQVVVNLVGNAIKFTEQGEVVVDVELEREHEAEVALHFAVRDTGPGIPSEQQRRIFEAFAQGSVEARRAGGVGLGLAIATGLVELMGGRLWVESEPGRGSTFHFTVTLRRARPAEPRAPRRVLPAGAHVLVVDDNATSRRILVEMLESWGLVPTAAADGPAALGALAEAHDRGTPYRLALVDGWLRAGDGVDLVRRVRADPRFAGLRVVLLTTTPCDEEQLRALGVAECLAKPVSHSQLLETLERVLGGATPEPAPPPPPTEASPRRLRVLLAEDNPVNRAVAVRMLEQLGHEVVAVGDGREALAALERGGFDVALMDGQMPELNGDEVAVAVRERERGTGGHVPIVAMTAYAMRGDRERFLAAGMDGYLAKPVRLANLREALDAVVAPRPEEASPTRAA